MTFAMDAVMEDGHESGGLMITEPRKQKVLGGLFLGQV